MQKQVSLVAAFFLLICQLLNATDVTVTSTANGGPNTLRAAIASLSNVGTHNVYFNLPAYSSIVLSSRISIANKNISIHGPGADLLSIQMNAYTDRIFEISGTSVITFYDLSIENGGNPNLSGGAMTVEGNAQVGL